jgi:hypothetical protein
MRVCACGTQLERSNTTNECALCKRLRIDSEIMRDPRARHALVARRVAGTFAQPQKYATKQEYLAALDGGLCELAAVVGVAPPDLGKVWS